MINYEIETYEKGFAIRMLLITYNIISGNRCIFRFDGKDTKINYIWGANDLSHANETEYSTVETTLHLNRKKLGINNGDNRINYD